MRMTASTLSDDHLLLVLATAEADAILQSATLQARTGRHHFRPNAATARAGNMAADIIPLPDSPQLARYALLLVDLLNDTLMA
jgi:hypothetical protein